jgi:hypothetical protein
MQSGAIHRARRQNRFFVAVPVPSVAEGGEILSVVAGAADEEIFDRISAAAAFHHRGVRGSDPRRLPEESAAGARVGWGGGLEAGEGGEGEECGFCRYHLGCSLVAAVEVVSGILGSLEVLSE